MSKTELLKKAGVSAIALTLAAGLCVPVPSLYAFAEEAAIEQVEGEAVATSEDSVNMVTWTIRYENAPSQTIELPEGTLPVEGKDFNPDPPDNFRAIVNIRQDAHEIEIFYRHIMVEWTVNIYYPDGTFSSSVVEVGEGLGIPDSAPSFDGYSTIRTLDEANHVLNVTYELNTNTWMVYTWFKDDYTEQEIKLPEGDKPVEDKDFTVPVRDGVKPAVEVNYDEHSGGGSISINYNFEQNITIRCLSAGDNKEIVPEQTIGASYYSGFWDGKLIPDANGELNPFSNGMVSQYIRDSLYNNGAIWDYSYCESTGSGDTGTLTLYFSQQKAATQTITFSYYGLVGYETVPGGTGPGGDYPEHEEPIWEEIFPSVTMNDIIEDDGFYDGSLKWETDPETGEYKQIPLPDIFIEDIDGWEYSHCLSVGDRGQGRTALYYTKKTDTPDASEYTYDLFYEDEDGNKLLPGTEITTAEDINDILAGMDMPDIDGYTFLRIEPDEESPMWVFHAIYKKNPADETPANPDTPETPDTPSEGETPDDEPLIETGTTPPAPQEPQETIENDPVPEAESLVQTGDTTPFIPVSVAALASLAALATAHITRKKND